MTAGRSQHIVVFGFKGVARRIVKQLAKVHPRVVVVDPQLADSEIDTLRRYGVQYVQGYGQSMEVLESVDVRNARAAICATNDDLHNIEIALLVRELSAEVKVIVQMANGNVGRALERVTQPSRVLEVADLASTAFVESAADRPTHAITLGRRRFYITNVVQPRTATLRSVWGDAAPIAVRAVASGITVTTPSRAREAQAGDTVTLLATAEELHAAGYGDRLQAPGPRRRHAWTRIREGLGAMLDAIERPFRIALGVTAGLGLISVLILTTSFVKPDGSRMGLLDAMYFTTETIATVGFGDFYFSGQAAPLRAWAIVMMLLGATLVYTASAFLTNALVSRRLAQSIGRQRVTAMRDHIVVIGLGAVGSKVALELQAAGYDVVVIDSGSGQRFVSQMRAARIPVLIGDPTLPETHREAGVHRAAGVAVLSNDDLLNIETGLAVKAVVGERKVPVALRVFGRNLARVIDSSLEIGTTRSVAELSAPWFVGAAVGLDVIGTFYVDHAPFLAARISVRRDDRLHDRAINHLSESTRFVAIDRSDGSFEYPLQRDAVFRAGDSAYVVGRFEDLLDLMQLH